MGLQQVHGIDGDLGNPYTDGTAQKGGIPATFDGTLDYGGKYADIPVTTKAGVVFLVLGLIVGGTVLIKDKKCKSHTE